MTPDKWKKIDEIFQKAVDCPAAQRASFVRQLCGDDVELQAEVELLISNSVTGNSFLEAPVWSDDIFSQVTLRDKIASFFDEDDVHCQKDDWHVGQTIGPYHLDEEIGRGGMGVVYLASREQDFRQKVALKIVKRGMDTDFVLRRFRQERRVLAALDHPHIARLLDGGTTADGRPYLVMEYIEGLPIDRFCDEQKLTIAERLRLFQSVCSAVAFSHQRLVIHRDIKPSNILVTKDGTPKLLDFGIAKLLDPALASPSYQPTATAARMMTPDYASPEQLRGEEVTTVSDVYSLGVLLYFLLTGHLPFNFAIAAQRGNFAQIVSEQKPERPSAIVTGSRKTTLKNTGGQIDKNFSTAVAENRRTQPERLRRYLAEDLDNIVLKALRKEADRRYSSVEQFSEDIRRHLSGLPVKARGDDFVYKSRKFIQRHKTGVVAAALLTVTLAGGITATGWQTTIANQERARAEFEKERAERRFDESRRLTESLMFEMHDAIQNLQGATAARELLAKRTLEHLDNLASEAAGDAGLQRELAIAYINLGNVQGNPYYPNLGDTNGALASYRKSENLSAALSADQPENVKLQRLYWLTQIRIGDVLTAQGDWQNGKQIYTQALSLIEKLAAANPAEKSLRADVASSYDRQENISVKADDFQGALAYYGKALEFFEQMADSNPGDDAILRSLAAAHGKIGITHVKAGAPEKALPSYEKLLRINESRLEKDPSNAVTLDDVAGSRRVMGDALTALGDYRKAFENYNKQLQIYNQLAAADSVNIKTAVELAVAYQRLGILETKIKNFAKALENHEKALTVLRQVELKNPASTFILDQLPAAYYYLGQVNFALASSAKTVAVKNIRLEKACSFLAQNKKDYSQISVPNAALPEGENLLNAIEKRLAECQSGLAEIK